MLTFFADHFYPFHLQKAFIKFDDFVERVKGALVVEITPSGASMQHRE
jgi:hypothetical protein